MIAITELQKAINDALSGNVDYTERLLNADDTVKQVPILAGVVDSGQVLPYGHIGSIEVWDESLKDFEIYRYFCQISFYSKETSSNSQIQEMTSNAYKILQVPLKFGTLGNSGQKIVSTRLGVSADGKLLTSTIGLRVEIS